jgi:signal transduction histidine kinase
MPSEIQHVIRAHGIRLSSDTGSRSFCGRITSKYMIPDPPRFLSCAVLLMAAAVSRGQEAGKPLESIEAVLALDPAAVQDKPLPVRVETVVLGSSTYFNYFHVHDGRHGIAVRYPRRLTPPKQGDRVLVIGQTLVTPTPAGAFMRVSADDFQITGNVALPDPEPADAAKLLAHASMDQWVTFEGTIVEWRHQAPDLLVRLILNDGVFDANITLPAPAVPPSRLFGARVRVTGAISSTPQFGRVLFVPDLRQMETLRAGDNDPFATPEAAAAKVAAREVEPAQPVRVRGVVLGHTTNGILHLRGAGGDAALRVQMLQPWDRVERQRGTWAGVNPGDEVEVVGARLANDTAMTMPGCDLYECHLRSTGQKVEIKPVVARLAEIAAGAHTADLVETRGRLLTLQQVPLDQGEWRASMLIEADGEKLPVTLRTQSRAALDTIKEDDDVLVRGLVQRATALDPRLIRVLDAGDVKSLGLSPVVRARQLWLWAGSVLAVVLIFSGWIAALRKSNRVKSEVASLLEKSVNERTAELQKAQVEIARALEHERELGELKSRFVTMVSHEFRTPLGIIMSAVELMRHYNDKLPPEQRVELQNDIFGATRHMAGLMEQVLVLGRVEAGKLGCKTAPCDLDIIAGKIVDENLSATNRKCPVHWHAEGDLRGAQADEALLRHIFGNLITNAVKYSPEGGEVLFTGRREGDDAVFEVIDHGIGIPENERERLFEAFHRCSNVGETPGTGLGLVIVKRCVDLHGGTLAFESTLGRGTTFTVRLPLFNG